MMYSYLKIGIQIQPQYAEYKTINMDLYKAWDRRVHVILQFIKKDDGSVEIIEKRNRNIINKNESEDLPYE